MLRRSRTTAIFGVYRVFQTLISTSGVSDISLALLVVGFYRKDNYKSAKKRRIAPPLTTLRIIQFKSNRKMQCGPVSPS
ncbi:hypothetical protein SDC9_93681 [bioreactor metagenome]|uniref:Uncharacterized protein n=1 Tax=bioreactor metagenome TaxID=1076179 RepID=A0A645ABB4_9ZZZZ